MSRRDRQKKKGAQLEPGWAPLYENILKTEAVKTLSPAVFKFYVVTCSLCKTWNNGAVPLVRSVLKDFGIVSGSAIKHGTDTLLELKLIVRTRKWRPLHAALYGVTHLPLNHEAMKKAKGGGARDPREDSTPSAQRTVSDIATASNMQTVFSVRSTDTEPSAQRTVLPQKEADSVRSADPVPPFLASDTVHTADTSKNLPCSTGPDGGADGSL